VARRRHNPRQGKTALNFFIADAVIDAIRKAPIVPPEHEYLAPQDLSTRTRMILCLWLNEHGFNFPLKDFAVSQTTAPGRPKAPVQARPANPPRSKMRGRRTPTAGSVTNQERHNVGLQADRGGPVPDSALHTQSASATQDAQVPSKPAQRNEAPSSVQDTPTLAELKADADEVTRHVLGLPKGR
jgi:hypothetical protein